MAIRASDFIRNLAADGIHHFSLGDAINALGVSPTAARAQLRRLKDKVRVAEPVKGFFVTVPPEYMRLGCVPAEHFIDKLMHNWGEPYYICLLSAAERHGAAHQRPQVTQVMFRRNRPPIECAGIRLEFIARRDLDRMPVTVINTPRGSVRYASPESTALELVGYPGHCGGIGNVATVLSELADAIAPEKLLDAAGLCPIAWSQRLGYLLEEVGHEELAATLVHLVTNNARSYTPLRRAAGIRDAARSARWKLIINADAEPDFDTAGQYRRMEKPRALGT